MGRHRTRPPGSNPRTIHQRQQLPRRQIRYRNLRRHRRTPLRKPIHQLRSRNTQVGNNSRHHIVKPRAGTAQQTLIQINLSFRGKDSLLLVGQSVLHPLHHGGGLQMVTGERINSVEAENAHNPVLHRLTSPRSPQARTPRSPKARTSLSPQARTPRTRVKTAGFGQSP